MAALPPAPRLRSTLSPSPLRLPHGAILAFEAPVGTTGRDGDLWLSVEFRARRPHMLTGRSVLIAEDEPITAMDLAAAVTHAHGQVVGPVSTLAEGMAMVAAGLVHGAILDVQLIDGEVTPLAHVLLDRGATVVFHSASPIPGAITARHGAMAYCLKPTVSDRVIARLISLFADGKDLANGGADRRDT